MKKLVVLSQILLKTLGTFALIVAASSAAITWAQSPITLVSGSGAVGSRDAVNQFTLDGGVTFQDAFIVPRHPLYSLIPGTNYISSSADSTGFPFTTVRYRTTFQLPEGFSGPSITVDIHADNAATIFLNGTQIGQQTQAEIPPNFQDPAESYSTSSASLFHSGTNVMEFDIRNFNDPTAFDYRAVVSYTAPLQVAIDIKPGSSQNTINLGANGDVPVAILSSATFDATTVNPTTVTLAGASVAFRGRGTPISSAQDVNGDGLLDLVVHVSTEALQLSDEDTNATLLGQTYGGQFITGTDSVRIVP